jgi:hypothetical protein
MHCTYWLRQAGTCTAGYSEATKALRALPVWCPAEKDETPLTKYLGHPEQLEAEKLAYGKDLPLVPKKKLARYRQLAYNTPGKSRLKWARLRPPERGDGISAPPPRTLDDLLPGAVREYIEQNRAGKEPVMTKEELLQLFRTRRGHTRSELGRELYQGEDVDYQHRHDREGRRGCTMPWEWIPVERATHLFRMDGRGRQSYSTSGTRYVRTPSRKHRVTISPFGANDCRIILTYMTRSVLRKGH